jgi:hypothetical protein
MIFYEDEYGVLLYRDDKSVNPPNVGELVIIDEVEWHVKSRTFVPKKSMVVVEVSENPAMSRGSEVKDTRLAEMKSAILEVQTQQTMHGKRIKALREQAMDIRSHIRVQDSKKDQ